MTMSNTTLSRRGFVAATVLPAMQAATPPIGLAIGTYGMKSLPWVDALRLIRDTGFDGAELSLIAGWPTAPESLDVHARRELRARATDWKLALPAFLENLQIDGTATKRAANLDRLQRAFELGHDLAPKSPPLVETVLGGKTGDWERLKPLFVAELREWARVAEASRCTVCVKPHAAHAIHSPERALWLLQEVGGRRIRVVYDYSHMFIEGFAMEESMRQLLPYAPFLHMKDATGTPEKHNYLLPGDGKTDYVEYFRLLQRYRFRGFATVEVSAMIHRQPGYQPVPVTRLCYQRMTAAMKAAGVRRPARPRTGYSIE